MLKVIVPAEDLAERKGGTEVETVGGAASCTARTCNGWDGNAARREQNSTGPYRGDSLLSMLSMPSAALLLLMSALPVESLHSQV